MLDSDSICRLYSNVLYNDIVVKKISPRSIREGIRCMAKAYSSESANFNSNNPDFPDYNHAALRCAYLHKYAPLHTYIVFDAILEILRQKRHVFQRLVRSGDFKFCCLGGGPGNDVIAILAALFTAFNFFKASATVIDLKKDWEFTFKSVIDELKYGEYGEIWRTLAENLNWSYIGANLLDAMTNEVNKSIGFASFVTMIRFVSAASCTSVERMLEKIFHVMKPGALVLFIDNAAGGFAQAVERASEKNSFEAVMPPRRHVLYDKDVFKTERFGIKSCSKSKVTILLLRKSLNLNQRAEGGLSETKSFTQFVPFVPTIDIMNQNVLVPSSSKIIRKCDNLDNNFEKTNSNSNKLFIKEENLNLLHHQQKNLPVEKRIVSAPSKSESSTRRDNSSSKSICRLTNNSSLLSSSKSNPSMKKGNLYSVSRKTQLNAVNNKIDNSSYIPSSSPRASMKSAVRLQPNSTSDCRPVLSPGRHENQETSDDVDNTCCLCCVIS